MNAIVLFVLLVGLVFWQAVRQLKRRGMDRWIIPYAFGVSRRPPIRRDRPIHVLLCIADHFEPQFGGANHAQAMERVQIWKSRYPAAFSGFRDSDGRTPRQTFFYPMEMYDSEEVSALTELCQSGFGEVEAHLHHDGDTPDSLRKTLLEFKETFGKKHRLLSRNRVTGELAYGFIHGNWALCNSHPEGRWCGVNDELTILRETGCYADFTFPSAPSLTQTQKINSIYYAQSNPDFAGAHGRGIDIGVGSKPKDSLLLFQGPLLLDWSAKKWGCLPAVENACLQHKQAATEARLWLWLKAGVQVPARPDWNFVKLHTHGAPEKNHDALLGEPMISFHRSLAKLAESNSNFKFHYITAREMYNLAKAAEGGWKGSVFDALDHELVSNIK